MATRSTHWSLECIRIWDQKSSYQGPPFTKIKKNDIGNIWFQHDHTTFHTAEVTLGQDWIISWPHIILWEIIRYFSENQKVFRYNTKTSYKKINHFIRKVENTFLIKSGLAIIDWKPTYEKVGSFLILFSYSFLEVKRSQGIFIKYQRVFLLNVEWYFYKRPENLLLVDRKSC